MFEQFPTISVVTPNLNGAKTLRRTIDSVLHQEYPNLEYIIVDGGSTDDSHAIIDDYRSQLAGVIIGRDATLYDGVAKGFEVASGEILAWLNSDDTYEPGALLRVGECFARHRSWAVVYFDDSVRKQGWRVANRTQKFVQLPELLAGHIIYQASTFFRRSAYEAVGGLERHNLRFAADYQLWLRLAARFELHYLPGHASAFQIRPTQLSRDWGAYMGEVAAVRQGAEQHLPRFFWWRTIPARAVRKAKSHIHERRLRLHFPLHSEDCDWSPVTEIETADISECRCPVCKLYPERLLFSLPDVERKIRSIYFCAECQVAFLFPKPKVDELSRLMSMQNDTTPPLPEPLRSRDAFSRRPWYFIAGLATRGTRRTPRFDLQRRGCVRPPVLSIGNNTTYTGTSVMHIDATAASAELTVDSSFRTIILDNALERFLDPLAIMKTLHEHLLPGGHIHVITPNLNSAWLQHYGPRWAYWNAPFHTTILSPTGLRELARRTGFSVNYFSSRTDADGLVRSERCANPQAAAGAALLSRLARDRRGRGDRLVACLNEVE